MPWVTNDHGISEYKLSIYTKEELPTWNEVYQEFYEKFGATFYDPGNPYHVEPDHYWKIPRYKYLLAIVCNQFNKMIWEDGYKDPLMDFVMREVDTDAYHMRFFLGDFKCINENKRMVWKIHPMDKEPMIYTFPFPNGQPNPFIIDKDIKRCTITEMFSDNEFLHLVPVVYFNDGIVALDDESEVSKSIIEFMMKPFASYFEDGIGWKE